MNDVKMEVEMPAEYKPQFEVVDENTIRCSMIPPTPEPIERTYDYDELILERAGIVDRVNKLIAPEQARLDQIDAIITNCQLLGIKSKADNGQLPKIG